MPCFGRESFRRAARLLPLISLLLLCASCSDFWVSNSSTASVTLSPGVILKTGDTYQLSVFAQNVAGTNTDVTSTATWTSSNPAVVTVVAGKLTVVGTPVADTKVVITAAFGGQSATCNVLTYTGSAPTTIAVGAIPAASGQLALGQVFQLTASANISGNATHDISSYVTWVSSNTSAATVSTTGVVTVSTNATASLATFTITATGNFANGSVADPVSSTPVSFTVI